MLFPNPVVDAMLMRLQQMRAAHIHDQSAADTALVQEFLASARARKVSGRSINEKLSSVAGG